MNKLELETWQTYLDVLSNDCIVATSQIYKPEIDKLLVLVKKGS